MLPLEYLSEGVIFHSFIFPISVQPRGQHTLLQQTNNHLFSEDIWNWKIGTNSCIPKMTFQNLFFFAEFPNVIFEIKILC